MMKTFDVKQCAIDPLLERELTLLERLNPCQQTYYKTPSAFVITYRQKVDLFNFSKHQQWKVSVTIVGKPYSISEKGYFGSDQAVTALISSMKGLKIVLNGEKGLDLPCAFTLQSHVFYNRFHSFEHYLTSLRSHYRYRVKKALKRFESVSVTALAPEAFTKEHYALYLEVYQESKDQLECLSEAFFKEFPSDLYEFRSRDSGELIGFLQLVQKTDQLIFLFGGFKKSHNRSLDLYMGMLLFIIQTGISRGVSAIEFGQTAEETKLKLGCTPVEKYLYVHHSNKMLQGIIKRMLPRLSYKPPSVVYKVFKEV